MKNPQLFIDRDHRNLIAITDGAQKRAISGRKGKTPQIKELRNILDGPEGPDTLPAKVKEHNGVVYIGFQKNGKVKYPFTISKDAKSYMTRNLLEEHGVLESIAEDMGEFVKQIREEYNIDFEVSLSRGHIHTINNLAVEYINKGSDKKA